MLSFESPNGAHGTDPITRRDFLRVGGVAAGTAGLSLADLTQLPRAGAAADGNVNCILLFLVGGPSQLDTWDLKPNAPENIRGPFAPIKTNVPGMEICEHFPYMAKIADQFAIVRSVHHQEAPIHETGQQLCKPDISSAAVANIRIMAPCFRICAADAPTICRRLSCCRDRWATRA
jgi:hypothetical protein